MKRILFLITSLNGGGAERILLTLVNELCKKSQLDITVMALFGGGIYENMLDSRIHYRAVFSGKNDNKIRALVKRIQLKMLCILDEKFLYRNIVCDKYDVEVAFLEGLPTKIIAGASGKKAMKCAWIHTNLKMHPYSTNAFRNVMHEETCYRRFDKVFCVSEDVRKAFEEKYACSAHVLYNPIDSKEIERKSTLYDVESLAGCHIEMVSVGRMVEQKGFDRLINIIARLKADGFNFGLKLIGDGILRDQLAEQAERMKVNDIIDFVGFTENPYPYVAKADLFVCSSVTEGFSTAVSESVILGTPVITTKCAGMEEIFGDSKCGLIVENSEEALYKGLKSIMENPEILSLYTEECLKRKPFFEIENTVSKVLSAIEIEK